MAIHQVRDGLITSGQFPELLNAEQVSGLLGVSAATLNRWAATREQTGQGRPTLLRLVRSRAAMGCRRSAQMASTGAPLDGRIGAARHSEAPQHFRARRAIKSDTWCGMRSCLPDG